MFDFDDASNDATIGRERRDDEWAGNSPEPDPFDTMEAHLAMSEAEALSDRGEWDGALRRLSDAFEALDEPALRRQLVEYASTIATNGHRPTVARDAALAALRSYEACGLEPGEYALLGLGYALSDLGEHDDALEVYGAVRDRFEASDIWTGVAHVDMNIAIVYTAQGRPEEAIQLLESAAHVFEQEGFPDSAASCRTNLLDALRGAKRFDEATSIGTQLVEHCRVVGSRRRLADSVFNLAEVNAAAQRWEAARAGYIEAMEMYRNINLPTEQADCLDALGVIARHDGLFDFSAAMHTEAVRLYEGTHHDCDQANARYHLAIAQVQLGHFADAMVNADLATGVRGSLLDPAVVKAAALDALGEHAEADQLRSGFIERQGTQRFEDELTMLLDVPSKRDSH